jgi:adenylylsulfate kinase-like enzyme
MAKNIIGEDHFLLVHLDTNIEICEERDPKGLYAKARKNELLNFTGIHQPYEKPINAQITFRDNFNIKEAAQAIFNEYKGYL